MSIFKLNTNIPFVDQLLSIDNLTPDSLVDINGTQLSVNDAKEFIEDSYAPNNKVEALKQSFISTAETTKSELNSDQLNDIVDITGIHRDEVNNIYKDYYLPTLQGIKTNFDKTIMTEPLKSDSTLDIINTWDNEPDADVRKFLNDSNPDGDAGFFPASMSVESNQEYNDELWKKIKEERKARLNQQVEKDNGNFTLNMLKVAGASAASSITSIAEAGGTWLESKVPLGGIKFGDDSGSFTIGDLVPKYVSPKEWEKLDKASDTFLESINKTYEQTIEKDPDNAFWYSAGALGGIFFDPIATKLFSLGTTEKFQKGLFRTENFWDKAALSGLYGAVGGAGYDLIQKSPDIVEGTFTDQDLKEVGLWAGIGGVLNPLFNKNIPFKEQFKEYGKRIGQGKYATAVKESPTIQQGIKEMKPVMDNLKQTYKDAFAFTKPLKEFYSKNIGEPVWNLISGNAVSVPGTVIGGATGWGLTGEDASMMEKITAGALGAAAGYSVGKLKINNESLENMVGRQIMNDYLIPAELKTIKQWAAANTKHISERFAKVVRQVQAIEDPELQKQLYRIIAGEVDRRSTPKELREVSKEAIELIKDVGQQMVDAGLLSPEVYKKNAGKYLHRTYSKHLSEQVGKNNYRNSTFFRIIGDALKPRGITLDVTQKQFDKTFKAQGFKILTETPTQKMTVSMAEFNKTFKQRGFEILATTGNKKVIIGKPQLKIRRDYTKDERALLGEIENASFAIAETGRLMTNDLTMAEMFRDIAKNNTLALSEAQFLRSRPDAARFKSSSKDTWVQVPTTKIPKTNLTRYGNLAGYYVPREVLTDLKSMTSYRQFAGDNPLGSKFTDAYRKSLSIWKRSKTAWNPAVHMNNTMSNVLMYDFADANYSYIPQAMKVLSGKEDNELYVLAERFGVFDGSYVKNELHDFTGDMRQGLARLAEDAKSAGFNPANSSLNYANRMSKYGAIALDKLGIKESGSYGLSGAGAILGYLNSDDDDSLMEHIENMAYGAVGGFALGKTKLGEKLYRNTLGKLEDMYQYEDQVFRMGIFLDRLGRGMKPDVAALDAKKWMIDYNINAPFINTLRYVATPFLSYTYRVVPLLAETVVNKPWKVGKWAGLAYGLNKIGSSFGYGDEEYERAIGDDRMRSTLWGLPKMPYTKIKTPFVGAERGVEGNVQPIYLDTSRWVPGGDIFSLDGATGAEPLLKGLPAPLNPSFGLAGEIVTPYLGIDNFTWSRLKGLGLSEAKDSEIKRAHFLSKLTPNFPLPYITNSYSSAKIEQAMTGQRDPLQIRFSPTEAVLNSLGVKVEPFDTERQKIFRAFEVNDKIDAYQDNVLQLYKQYQRGQITEEELENEVKELEKILLKEIEPVMERVQKHSGGLIKGVAQVVDRPEERASKYLQGQTFGQAAGDIISYDTAYEREKYQSGGKVGFLMNLRDNFKKAFGKYTEDPFEIDNGFKIVEELLNDKPTYQILRNDLETLNIPTKVTSVFGKPHMTSQARLDAEANFVKDSVIKDDVFRAELNNDIKDTLYRFALPTEMGAHFGNQWQANNIMFKRTVNDKEVLQELLPNIAKVKGGTYGKINLKAQELDQAIGKLWEDVFKGPELIEKYVGKGMDRETLKDLVLASTLVRNKDYRGYYDKIRMISEAEMFDMQTALPYLKNLAEQAKTKYGFDIETDGKSLIHYLMIANDKGLKGQIGRKAPVMLKGKLNITNPLVIESENMIGGWSPNFLFKNMGRYPELHSEVVNGIRKVIGRDLTKGELDTAKMIHSNNLLSHRKMTALQYDLRQLGLEDFAHNLDAYKLPYAKFAKDMQNYLEWFGIDGIKYGNMVEITPADAKDIYSYIAFKPEQFKTFNSFAFNKRDPRHQFFKGGVVDE